MSKNSYLNLRFVNIIQSIRATPYTAAELYSASYVRSFSDIEQTGRLLRQARVESCADFEDYLISLRDVNAWKIGVFKFFYNFYKAYPDKLLTLSVIKDAPLMEKFIENIEMDPKLASFYEECGHDGHLALSYSVSKIICDEKRLSWMNTFCSMFMNLLAIGENTGIIALTLVRQLDLVESAFALGIITEDERQRLLNQTGSRIVTMFGSWGRFLTGILLSHLYEICLSSAELRYLPKRAQELLDSYYLCCNNDIQRYLPIKDWQVDDIPEFKNALRPHVDHVLLDSMWNSIDSRSLANISILSSAFYFYQHHIQPFIDESHIDAYFKDFGKYDEFIPVINGFDFKVYFESLKLPLDNGELPLFVMRFNMFTTKGVWSFDPYKGRSFKKWPDKLEVEVGLPVNKDYGNLTIPFFISNVDAEFALQIPSHYNSERGFIELSSYDQMWILDKDIASLKKFFENLPTYILQPEIMAKDDESLAIESFNSK
ncbi:MAG: hypothetical protein UHG91_09165 [Succinivibrionaceae bacterium]|nr:DUF1266 domain-containing protein [Ruminobacter sp.]MDY5779666.1 hypothetical protein [Succinivibrionaceae bacterium]MEE1340922.1 hypothetical protein [Succinivibrionaceae bacterium]